jgi:hypothetical protein
MNNDIFEIVNILNNNHLVRKVNEVPIAKESGKTDKNDNDDSNIEFDESSPEEFIKRFFGGDRDIELNGYSNPAELDKYLSECFNKFKSTSVMSDLEKNKILQNEIVQRVFSIRTELEQLKLGSINPRYKNYIPLINIKIEYCDKIILFLSNIKTETLKLSGKKKSNSSLTQKQIVILFHHLHKLGYVGKGLNTDDLAIILSEMTGFSSTKLRQDLSHVKKESNSIDSEEFKDSDYTIIKRSLKRLIESIDKDQKE